MAYTILLPLDSSSCSLKAAEYVAQLMNTNDDIQVIAVFPKAFTRDLALFLAFCFWGLACFFIMSSGVRTKEVGVWHLLMVGL